MTIGLTHYIVLSAVVFSIGVYGVLTRRNAIGLLMSTELMLNAVNINMAAVSRYVAGAGINGHVFVVFIVAVAAAESVLGLAIILALYRKRLVVNADEMDLMKW